MKWLKIIIKSLPSDLGGSLTGSRGSKPASIFKENKMQSIKNGNIKPLLSKYNIDGNIYWGGWLSEFEDNLKKLGYVKYVQGYKKEGNNI